MYQMVGSASSGSGPINHRIFSFHRKFFLNNKMSVWRFEPPTFGTDLNLRPLAQLTSIDVNS
jgi:hypothetical protein